MIHETRFRVRYSEADSQRIANNANYLSYFEVGRVEWMRAIGFSYRELEDRGLGFVVVEARLFYKRAARFDDELTLRTELAELNRASLRFEYAVLRDGEELATGYTRHGCIDIGSGKARRLPEGFLALVPEARARG